MSCEVGPAGLATTRMPSSSVPVAIRPGLRVVSRRPPPLELADQALGLRKHQRPRLRQRQRHRRAGRPGVPSPAERAGQHGRIHAAVLGAHAEPRLGALVLEDDRDLAGLGLRQQVDQALGHLRRGAGRRVVGGQQLGPQQPPVQGRLQARQHQPEEVQLRVRLGAVEPPCAMSYSGAPAARSSLATRSVRAVVLGCWKLAVSMTTPAIRLAAIAPSAASSGTPRRGRSSVTISHVAGRVRIDPVERAEADVGLVMVDVDDGHAREQLGMLLEHRAHALEVAAVADDDQVVIQVRVRRLAEAAHLRQEEVGVRNRVCAHGRGPLAERLQRQRQPERRAERVRLRVAVADGHHRSRGGDRGDHLVPGPPQGPRRSARRRGRYAPQRPRRGGFPAAHCLGRSPRPPALAAAPSVPCAPR